MLHGAAPLLSLQRSSVIPTNYQLVPVVMALKRRVRAGAGTYPTTDLEPFAQDILEEVGAETWNRWFPDNPLSDGKPAPFRWDEERRATLWAELDAIYAHLYGLARDELDYILETFPIVKRKDVERYRCFRTKEMMVMKLFDQYAWMKIITTL